MSREQEDPLAELKSLLLGEEQAHIEHLEERVVDPGNRAKDIAEVLPEAIHIGGRQNDGLIRALESPVNECVRRSVQKDIRMYADALFPVMGPSIRRYITEALKGFVQTINQTIEQSVSAKGLKWRFESLRTGVPFAQIVLRHTMLYRVEQVFLIHKESGLLIEHVAPVDIETKDSDAVGAMLTAIQDFVRDSFAGEDGGDLETVELGEYTLLLTRQAHTFMAVAVRGISPQLANIRARMDDVAADIQMRYADHLEAFIGDKSDFEDVDELLQECLVSQERPADNGGKKRIGWPFLILSALVLSLVGWQSWEQWQRDEQRQKLRSALENTPGIVVVDMEPQENQLLIRGLRDPLAASPDDIARQAGYTDGPVLFDLAPYQALLHDFILQRAQAQYQPPDGVQLKLENDTLYFSGSAGLPWVEQVRSNLLRPEGIQRIDTAELQVTQDSLLAEAKRRLSPPRGVTIALNEDGQLDIGGRASWYWLQSVADRLQGTTGLTGYRFGQIDILEWQQAQRLANRIRRLQIHFIDGPAMSPDGRFQLESFSEALMRLYNLHEHIGLGLKVTLTGYSDNTGPEQRNLDVRLARAQSVRRALLNEGIDAGLIQAVAAPGYQPSKFVDFQQRRVDIGISLAAPDLNGRSE